MKLFSEEQRRGAVVLLPLMVIVVLLVALGERRSVRSDDAVQGAESVEGVEIKSFDPNVFEYEELRDAGVPAEIAAGIVRWRKYGKVYRIREDVALVSGVTDSIYARLKPYIVIADSLAPKSRYENSRGEFKGVSVGGDVERLDRRGKVNSTEGRDSVRLVPFMIDTASVEFLESVGFSPKQAQVVANYRDALGGVVNEAKFRECYVVSDRMAERLVPYIIFSESVEDEPTVQDETASERPRVEINSADFEELVAVNGIGEKSAEEIIKYRELLGGYHSIEQLRELNCITEQNFAIFLSQIYCDSCKIKKIDINFAGPKKLERHPYVSARTLRRIVKQRQLKGGWSRIEEMTEQNILSEDEAKRLAPYLRFGLEATE